MELLGSLGVAEDGFDDRATLRAGGSEHDENLLGCHVASINVIDNERYQLK